MDEAVLIQLMVRDYAEAHANAVLGRLNTALNMPAKMELERIVTDKMKLVNNAIDQMSRRLGPRPFTPRWWNATINGTSRLSQRDPNGSWLDPALQALVSEEYSKQTRGQQMRLETREGSTNDMIEAIALLADHVERLKALLGTK